MAARPDRLAIGGELGEEHAVVGRLAGYRVRAELGGTDGIDEVRGLPGDAVFRGCRHPIESVPTGRAIAGQFGAKHRVGDATREEHGRRAHDMAVGRAVEREVGDKGVCRHAGLVGRDYADAVVARVRDEKRAEAIGHQTARGVEPGDTAHLVVDVPGRAAGRVTRDGLHVTKRRDPPDQVRAGVGNVEVAVTITRNARRGVERCCRVGAIRATGGESGGEPAGEMVGSPSRVGPLQPHDAVVGRVGDKNVGA